MIDRRAVIEDETTITEIVIQPDGRIYVFGPSLGILEILQEMAPENPQLRRILQQIRPGSVDAAARVESK